MMKFRKRTVILAALALGLSLAGSHARADLTLDVKSASGIEINIDSSTGFANLTGATPNATIIYNINGTPTVFMTDALGNATNVTPFATSNTVTDFVASGALLGVPIGSITNLSTFDSYKVSSINITQVTGLGRSSLTDITTDVSGTASNTVAPDLTITPGTLFSTPNGPVLVTSALSSSMLDSGTVTFRSTINGTNVPSSPLSLSSPGFVSGNATLTVPSSYSVSNQIVISGLLGTGTDSITASTTVAAPEPSTVAAAITGLGLIGLTSLRRKHRNRA